MKVIAFALLLLLCGCATVDYQPYVGKNNVFYGNGGTKIFVNDVDFWENGDPPQKFTLLGIVVSEVGAGRGDANAIRSAVAGEVKKRGGTAAILMQDNQSTGGVFRATPSLYVPVGVKHMKFAVIRYISEQKQPFEAK